MESVKKQRKKQKTPKKQTIKLTKLSQRIW